MNGIPFERREEAEAESAGRGGAKGVLARIAGLSPKWMRIALPILLLFGFLLTFFSGGGGEGYEAAADDELASQIEERLTQMLREVEGLSGVTVYATVQDGELAGVVVLCTEGNDPSVKEKVLGLVGALYSIGSHRVYVSGGRDSGLFRKEADGAHIGFEVCI